VPNDGVRISGVIVGCQKESISQFQIRSSPRLPAPSSRPMAPVISAPRVTHRVDMKLRSSFVHSHRTPIEHRSVQRSDSGLGFRRLRHLDKSHTPGLARVPVHNDPDGFDDTMRCKSLSQLLLCYRDIQVPDTNVGHEFISATDLPERPPRTCSGILRRRS
jgi:hypothetical protein